MALPVYYVRRRRHESRGHGLVLTYSTWEVVDRRTKDIVMKGMDQVGAKYVATKYNKALDNG